MHARRRKNTFQRRREHRFYRSFHRDRKRDPMHQLSTFLLDSTKQRSETKKKQWKRILVFSMEMQNIVIECE